MEEMRIRPEVAMGLLNAVERRRAPDFLYCAGELELLRKIPKVAVIGSRDASAQGIRRAGAIAKILATAGVAVVSGLARGIDTAAHRAAIEAGGRTIGILATPVDRCHPVENRQLQEEIGRRHLLVSQFEPGRPLARHHFPVRNRSMALIADATVIVEAGEGSGTLHQAWESLRLGRPLFLMESMLGKASLEWPRGLIDYGAEILTREGVDDLLRLLPRGSRDASHAFETG